MKSFINAGSLRRLEKTGTLRDPVVNEVTIYVSTALQSSHIDYETVADIAFLHTVVSGLDVFDVYHLNI